jgi:hypothetical protein
MRKVHLIFGALVVAAFLLTGQYMDRYHGHLSGMPDGPRMLYRTRHIFVLLAGLLNLAVGAYLTDRPRGRVFQLLGSGLLVAAPVLYIAAFFYEPGLGGLYTPLSHWGTYAVAGGVALHLLSGAGGGRQAASGGRRESAAAE